MWFTKSYSAAARWGEECVSVCARVCALSLRLLKRLDILILFLRDRLEQGDKWTTVEELSHRGPYHVSPLKVEIKVLHLSVHVIYSPISHLFCLFLCIWCCIWFSLFYLLPLARSLWDDQCAMLFDSSDTTETDNLWPLLHLVLKG